MDKLLVGVWRGPTLSAADLRAALTDRWAADVLSTPGVAGLTVSLADVDQGPYRRTPDERGLVPNADALLALWLDEASSLDAVPERDLLHHVARRVVVWRVDELCPKTRVRDWPDGVTAPGLTMVSFMRRAPGLTHQQFVRHWTERHTPLALEHHVGLCGYTQNVVRASYTPDGGDVDGIAELRFASRDDFETRFFDSDEGRRAILDDVARFMAPPAPDTALMTDLSLRTPPT